MDFIKGSTRLLITLSTRLILGHPGVHSHSPAPPAVALQMIFLCSYSSQCKKGTAEKDIQKEAKKEKKKKEDRKRTGLLTVQLDLMFCLNLHKCKYLTAFLVLFLFPFRQSICLHSITFPPSSLLFFSFTSENLQLFWQEFKDNNSSECEHCFVLKWYKSLSFY